jgi:hypothetical protein
MNVTKVAWLAGFLWWIHHAWKTDGICNNNINRLWRKINGSNDKKKTTPNFLPVVISRELAIPMSQVWQTSQTIRKWK